MTIASRKSPLAAFPSTDLLSRIDVVDLTRDATALVRTSGKRDVEASQASSCPSLVAQDGTKRRRIDKRPCSQAFTDSDGRNDSLQENFLFASSYTSDTNSGAQSAGAQSQLMDHASIEEDGKSHSRASDRPAAVHEVQGEEAKLCLKKDSVRSVEQDGNVRQAGAACHAGTLVPVAPSLQETVRCNELGSTYATVGNDPYAVCGVVTADALGKNPARREHTSKTILSASYMEEPATTAVGSFAPGSPRAMLQSQERSQSGQSPLPGISAQQRAVVKWFLVSGRAELEHLAERVETEVEESSMRIAEAFMDGQAVPDELRSRQKSLRARQSTITILQQSHATLSEAIKSRKKLQKQLNEELDENEIGSTTLADLQHCLQTIQSIAESVIRNMAEGGILSLENVPYDELLSPG